MERKIFGDFYGFMTTGVRGDAYMHDYNLFDHNNEWLLGVVIVGQKEYFLSEDEADSVVSTIKGLVK